MENLLLEIFGVACPTLLTYAATQHFAFSPVFGKAPKATNDLYMTFVPLVTYLVYRLYFGLIMAVCSKTSVSYRWYSVTRYLASFLVIMGMIAPSFHPSLQFQLLSLYQEYLDSLVKILYDSSKTDFLNAVELGKKIFLLLLGWFVIFFLVELVLRVLFAIFRGVYSAIILVLFEKKIASISLSSDVKDKRE
jgi:hypothetical protein